MPCHIDLFATECTLLVIFVCPSVCLAVRPLAVGWMAVCVVKSCRVCALVLISVCWSFGLVGLVCLFLTLVNFRCEKCVNKKIFKLFSNANSFWQQWNLLAGKMAPDITTVIQPFKKCSKIICYGRRSDLRPYCNSNK